MDINALITLLLALTNQIGPIAELVTRMRTEGRTALTPDERKWLDDKYDMAHAEAWAALIEARQRERGNRRRETFTYRLHRSPLLGNQAGHVGD